MVTHLLERGVRSEREPGLDGNALDGDREIGSRHSDAEDVAGLHLAWLAEHTSYGLSDIEAEVAAHAAAHPEEAEDGQGADEPEREDVNPDAHHGQPETGEPAEEDSTATGAD